ncbi:hypothetical protein VIGAN_06023800 [Vigna angularis var. angularis]|uniref:Secreted protein n=1 Tax=Vigna angularis var. angularis TaxID=157739 RepID=A0A0S3S954_PHAAN|nr:hypothetical protein VIGAN_06023800 [Vigna angularis var. angularis]
MTVCFFLVASIRPWVLFQITVHFFSSFNRGTPFSLPCYPIRAYNISLILGHHSLLLDRVGGMVNGEGWCSLLVDGNPCLKNQLHPLHG